jgi:multidrug resistance protein, MATE family
MVDPTLAAPPAASANGAERRQQVFRIALPIMGGMVSQNIMNLVDTAMVGRQGKAALAAVGMSSFAAFMSQALVMGLSSGVQAMAARRHGSGQSDDLAVPLNGGLLLAFALGLPLTLLVFFGAPHFYPYLNSDPEVIAIGTPYLQARACGIVAVGANFAFRGHFNGINMSRVYLRSILVMHACNLFLNYVLIFGALGFPKFGAVGAGIGTAASTYIGCISYFVMARRISTSSGFLRGLPDRKTMATMLELALPSCIRQFFFAGGLTTLFWIIGQLGTTELAASNVMVNLMLVAILPGIGLGLSATSLVGQALGREDPDDAYLWAWDVAKIAVVILASIGLIFFAIPDVLFSVFNLSAESIEVGRLPLRIIGASIWLDGIGLSMQYALLGAGDSRRVMVASIGIQWIIFLPIAYLVGPVLKLGLAAIWAAMAMQRLAQAILFSSLWRDRSWSKLRV